MTLKKYSRFVLVTLTAFVLLVTVKFFYSYKLASRTSGLGGIRHLQAVDYLFLGSSHTRQSYSARIIEAATGKSSYLLAYDGMDPVFMRETLSYLLDDQKLKIGHLVLEAYVFNAVAPFRLKDVRLFNDSPPDLKVRLLKLMTEKEGGLRWTQLYELLVTAGNESLLAAPFVNSFLNGKSYNGSYINHHTNSLSQERFSAIAANMPTTLTARLNPTQENAYRGIFDLIEQHGIVTSFVETPMPGPVNHSDVTREAKQRLAQLIQSKGFRYIDLGTRGEFDESDPALFEDWNHLSTTGRDTYSKIFVRSLLSGT